MQHRHAASRHGTTTRRGAASWLTAAGLLLAAALAPAPFFIWADAAERPLLAPPATTRPPAPPHGMPAPALAVPPPSAPQSASSSASPASRPAPAAPPSAGPLAPIPMPAARTRSLPPSPARGATGVPTGAAASAPPPPVRTFRSWKSGLCLGFATTKPPEGEPLRQQTCDSAYAVAFRLVPAAGGAVSLVEPGTGRCVDVATASFDDDAPVMLWRCNAAANQRFRTRAVTVAGAGSRVQLVVEHSGKCLDLKDQDTTPGAAVIQWACHTEAEEATWHSQSWLAS